MTNERKRTFIIIFIYFILFLVFYLVKFNNNDGNNISKQLALVDQTNSQTENADVTSENNEQEVSDIYIHISGEVNYPGLLKLEKGQRLYEAVDLAGGMTENADLDQINLSLILNDQDKIYIPGKGDNTNFIQTNASPIININTASKEDLMKLDGIGEKTADKIIEYRSNNGFSKIEDIMNVPGIGEQKFKQIQDEISI